MAGKKGKELKATIKLEIIAGQASPAPPLGPILGQNGIAIPDFVNQFNDKTKDMGNEVIPCIVKVFQDGSFNITIKQPTVNSMLKKTVNLQKGSANPKLEKVGKISRSQLKEIAERKLPDLNTVDLEAASKIVEGSARSLGLEIVD